MIKANVYTHEKKVLIFVKQTYKQFSYVTYIKWTLCLECKIANKTNTFYVVFLYLLHRTTITFKAPLYESALKDAFSI